MSFRANLLSTPLTSGILCCRFWGLCSPALPEFSWAAYWAFFSRMYVGAGDRGAPPLPVLPLRMSSTPETRESFVSLSFNSTATWWARSLFLTAVFFTTLNPSTTCQVIQDLSFLAWIIAAASYLFPWLKSCWNLYLPLPVPGIYNLDNAISIVKTWK